MWHHAAWALAVARLAAWAVRLGMRTPSTLTIGRVRMWQMSLALLLSCLSVNAVSASLQGKQYHVVLSFDMTWTQTK